MAFSTFEIQQNDTTKDDKYSNTFIVVNDRYFYIGKCGGSRGYTYSLSQEEREVLKERLGKHSIVCTHVADTTKFIDEVCSESERACCKPIIKIEGIKYNILNYNYRDILKTTSYEIQKYFEERGIEVDIQETGNNGYSTFVKKTKKK